MFIRVLLIWLVVGSSQQGLAQIRPTPAELAQMPIRWASVGVSPDYARDNALRLIDRDPQSRAAIISELRAAPEKQTRAVLASMFNSLVSVMGSDLPRRAEIAAGLSELFGELAREVRAAPRMPASVRVAFGRTQGRFLENYALVEELDKFRRTRQASAELARIGGVRITTDAGGGPGKLEWQVPATVPNEKLVSGQTAAVLTSMQGSLETMQGTLYGCNKQANRCRLVESRRFSSAFVAKQRAVLEKAKARAASQARHEVTSVPRLLEADLYKAFVWPEKPVTKERLLADLSSVDLSTAKPLWPVNRQGLDLRRGPDGLQLAATFETDIDNPAVLRSVKSSIEQLWTTQLSEGGQVIRLKTSVNFRKIDAGQKFTDGSLRLTEGVKNCASSGGINLCRVYAYTAPAHEFAHVLGVRDGYRTLYDPRARTFIHVQDQRTLLGSLNAPLSTQSVSAALRNLASRPAPRP